MKFGFGSIQIDHVWAGYGFGLVYVWVGSTLDGAKLGRVLVVSTMVLVRFGLRLGSISGQVQIELVQDVCYIPGCF